MRLGEQVLHRNVTIDSYCISDFLGIVNPNIGCNVQCYVDCKDTWTCYPRFINDCRNRDMYNVEFEKCPKEKCAWVKAMRDIETGEELFVGMN